MRTRVYALLAISAFGGAARPWPLFAQNQTLPQAGLPQAGAGEDQPDTGQLPLTPDQIRERQVRQIDPLDRNDKDSKQRDKAARDAEKRREQDRNPLPGSIAADQYSLQRGPQVVPDEGAEAPVQEYSGPAVLSRSYSISQPLIPEQVKWQESIGLSGVYDSGVARVINLDGSLGPASTLLGAQVSWGFAGRHYFRRDMLSVNYTGNYSQYSGVGAYNGGNQTIAVDYAHVLTRRLKLNLSGVGSILSQNYVLENQPVGPETIANINLASSPNIQIYDTGLKQFTTQADLTWQLTNRLSFSFGGSYFAVERDSALLLGMTGRQARSDVNYRLTRKMTVGAYYSYSSYLYPHGFGNADTNTAGLIYSYALNRSMQVRFRGGLSRIESLGLETVQITPAVAAILGQSTGVIDGYSVYRTSDFSAQFVKDFRDGATVSLSYARGISPGNGVFQTAQQESINGTLHVRVLRSYLFTAALGRDTLQAITQNLGKYQSEYARISLSRAYRRGMGLSLTAEFRYFNVANFDLLRDQLRITTGFTWGSGTGRLWPF